MKRLLVHVAISILAFCFGLGINRALTLESRPRVAPQDVELQHVKPIIVETPATPVGPAVTPTSHVIADYDVNKFYPEGSYSFAGRKPREFEEGFFLSLGRFVEAKGMPVGEIHVETLSNDKYESHDAAVGMITEKRLFFVTVPSSEEQFQYWFDGEFVKQKSGTYLVKGKLTKTKTGRKVAERVVTLRTIEDAC